MHRIFIGKDNKLRSGWRAFVFLICFVFVAATFRSLEEIIFTASPIAEYTSRLSFFAVNAAVLLAIALVLGYIAGRLFESLPYKALGASFTNIWFANWLLGLILGATTLGVAVVIVVIFGGNRFEFNAAAGFEAITTSLVVSLIVFALNAAWEEAFFRGYIFQTLARAHLAWLAILLTSVFFGLVHLGNQNSGIFSSLNTALAGVWFGLAYLKTRDLWFVWGLHLAWNWVQGSIFGIEVSGLTELATAPMLKEIDRGPEWLTGANYGIEGGIACTIALIASIAVINFLPNNNQPQINTDTHR